MVKIIDWTVLDPTILRLYEEGKSPFHISKQIGKDRGTLARHMELDLGIEIKKNGPRKFAEFVSETEIKCSICSETKDVSLYWKTKRDGYYSFCKACTADKGRVSYLKRDPSWSKRIYGIRDSASKRGIEFDLTQEYIQYLYTVQDQKCAYTGIALNLAVGRGLSSDSVSFDRFDPNVGYVVGNVLMCSSRANTIKHNQTPEELREWMPSWYQRGLDTLLEIDAGWPLNDLSSEVRDISERDEPVLVAV